MDADKVRGLVKAKTGISDDYMREWLVEMQYLPEDASVNDLYNAIEETLAGRPVFSERDIEAVLEWQDARNLERKRDRYGDAPSPEDVREGELRAALERVGAPDDPRASLADLEAELDERLALMDAADIDDARRRLAGAVETAVVESAEKGTQDGDFGEGNAGARDTEARRLAAGEPRSQIYAEPAGASEDRGADRGQAQPSVGGAGEARDALRSEATAADEQTVLPGAERSAIQAQAARDAKRGLRSETEQKPADEGLFAERADGQDRLLSGIDPGAIAGAVRDLVRGVGARLAPPANSGQRAKNAPLPSATEE